MKVYKLEQLTGPSSGSVNEFTILPINLGADDSNDIVFKDMPMVSKNHAIISDIKGEPFFYNHSKFETFINKELLTEKKLRGGEEIQLGIAGPKLKFTITEDSHKNSEGFSDTYTRWYDRDYLISKTMKLMENSNRDKVVEISEHIVEILNKQKKHDIFINPKINVENEINDLDIQCRWYDMNTIIQKVVETMRLAKPEIQQQLAAQIILLLNEEEDPEATAKEKCPKCFDNIIPNSKFCNNCGNNLVKTGAQKIVVCNGCANEAPEFHNFCFNCGLPFKKG